MAMIRRVLICAVLLAAANLGSSSAANAQDQDDAQRAVRGLYLVIDENPGPLAGHFVFKPRLAVLPLELTGDLGGADFAAEHATRLKIESDRLRRDLEGTALYEVVDAAPAQADIDKLKSQQLHLYDCNGCDIDIGRKLHADLVLAAWVNRVSGLILTLTYEIDRVSDAQIVARKSYDFRGDNDIAWNHAIDYMVRHLREDAQAAAHD
jgi:hypothetical protein